MKTTEETFTEIEKKHKEKIKTLRSRLIRGDWKTVIELCKKKGVAVSDAAHAIYIIENMSAKKHLAVFEALEQVINERMNRFQ